MKRKQKRRKNKNKACKAKPQVKEHACSLAKWKIGPSAGSQAPVEIWDADCRPIGSHPTVEAALATAGEEHCGEVWLWCLHCHRFFQAKHLVLDFLGNWQRCPHDDCQAAGFDVDILHWSNGKIDPLWPRESELRLGRQYPRGQRWSAALEGTCTVKQIDSTSASICLRSLPPHSIH